MMFKSFFALFFAIKLAVVLAKFPLFGDNHNPENIHAVLVSAVPCDGRCRLNYFADAEIAQTYHLLLDHGVPAKNIILFMNNGIANNDSINPYPGKLYTDLNMSRDYNEGLNIDYSGEEVTIANFLAVIRGEKDKVRGGTKRVLESNENNRVFFAHANHGGPGIFYFNHEQLTAKDLNKALKDANEKKMFKELVYYITACQSGSMFVNQLDKDGNIYVLTAAKPGVNTFAKDDLIKGEKYVTINSYFGQAWLVDTETHDTNKETLEEQYRVVQSQVDSFPSQYGNLKITDEKLANFEGNTKSASSKTRVKNFTSNNEMSGIPISPIASYLLLKRKIQKTNKFDAKYENLAAELEAMEKEQKSIKSSVESIIQSFTGSKFANSNDVYKSPESITQLDCHDDVVKFIGKNCGKILKSPFVNEFITPMVNLCEAKLDSQQIIEQIRKHCSN